MDRIVVVLPNWFGETLFITPFLRALRAMQPRSDVAVLGVDRALEMLRHHQGIADRIRWDAGAWAVLRRLRRERCDAAFILRRSLSRTALLKLGGVPRLIGVANPKSGWLLTDRVPSPGRPVHKAHAHLTLLSVLGPVPSPGRYEYLPGADERAWARALLRRQGLDGRGPLVVLHPGANWAHKRWPAERFGVLADRLSGSGAAVAISEGPGDRPLTQAVLGKMARPPVVLAGLDIRQLAACVEQVALLVSNDTGVLHLAAALGRPVVALYGPTSPALTGPLGDPQRTAVLHHPGCCPEVPCYRPEHPGFPGMEAITVEEAYASATRLLEKTS
jgi:ADP-heptose:LPS heptosyltransferase